MFLKEIQKTGFCNSLIQFSNPTNLGGLNISHFVNDMYPENITGNMKNTTVPIINGETNNKPQKLLFFIL